MKAKHFPYDVFISYRWVDPDQTWVRQQLVPALKRAGLKICLDVEDFVPGRDLILEMNRAGSESRHAICILSPDYFEGNRMVGFESLMARRFDPSGQESRLIPLILRETPLPEWIRGLISVDWTAQSDLLREWRKLLKVLNAKDLNVPAPNRIEELSGEKRTINHTPDIQIPQISIVSVSKLHPKDGEGLGYEVLLKNDSYEEIFVEATEISGIVEISVSGASPFFSRAKFEVHLDTAIASLIDISNLTTIAGSVYELSDQDWGIQCYGTLERQYATGISYWKYSFTVPTRVKIPPKDRIFLRIIFKKGRKYIIEWEKRGEHLASFEVTIRSEHSINIAIEGSETLTAKIDEGFLEFIANVVPLDNQSVDGSV